MGIAKICFLLANVNPRRVCRLIFIFFMPRFHVAVNSPSVFCSLKLRHLYAFEQKRKETLFLKIGQDFLG